MPPALLLMLSVQLWRHRCVVKDSYHLHYCWRYLCNCDDTHRCVVKDSYHLHYCWRYLCNCEDTGVLLRTHTTCITVDAICATVMTHRGVLLRTLTTCITVDAICATVMTQVMLLFFRQMFLTRAHCVCVVHWHCTAQLSMFNMEKCFRNKIIIIIIIITGVLLRTHTTCITVDVICATVKTQVCC